MATQALNPVDDSHPSPPPTSPPNQLPNQLPNQPSELPGQSFAHRTVLTLYRICAIVVLYAVLCGILAYAFIMGFYAVNYTWAAPVILSASDEKSLSYLGKLVTSRQSIEDLKVDVVRQQTSLAEMRSHRGQLIALDPELQQAIVRERAHDRQTGPQLASLESRKQSDNDQTQQMLKQLSQVKGQIQKDLTDGLITNGDAATQLAAINQASSQYTDSQIAQVMLTDSILDKTTTGTRSLDVLEKQAELRSEIAQLDVSIAVADKQLTEDNRQVERLRDAITTAKQSPYYLNASGTNRIYFAFVPYDNQINATVGSPIYDCYLNMVLCRKVGVVKKIFLGEEQITHPIFRTPVRGLMIQMDLSHPNSPSRRPYF